MEEKETKVITFYRGETVVTHSTMRSGHMLTLMNCHHYTETGQIVPATSYCMAGEINIKKLRDFLNELYPL